MATGKLRALVRRLLHPVRRRPAEEAEVLRQEAEPPVADRPPPPKAEEFGTAATRPGADAPLPPEPEAPTEATEQAGADKERAARMVADLAETQAPRAAQPLVPRRGRGDGRGRHFDPAPGHTATPSVDAERSASSAPSWEAPRSSADASCLQFSSAESQETVDLVIGLDFGTSSAKVAIRSPFLGRERGHVIAVTWPDGRGGRTFLLPTNLSEAGPDDRMTATAKPSPADRSLKVDLMENPDSEEARTMAACYLAWVLRTSRRHLLRSQREIYGNFSLRWTLNLGVPSEGYDDEAIKRGFLAAGKAAWALSVEEEPPTRSEAMAAVAGMSTPDSASEPLPSLVEIEVVPEIVAAVAGYAQSYERRNGLHFLADVGASTIDLCGFVLHEREGEDRWELLNTLVKPLGVLHLHIRRLDALADAGAAIHGPPVPPRDAGPFDRIPDRVNDYLEDRGAKPPGEATAVDRDYRKRLVEVLRPGIWELRKNRDPHADHWKEGLLVFLTGGGAGLSVLRRAFKEAEFEVRRVSQVISAFRYMNAQSADDDRPPTPPFDSGGSDESPPAASAVSARLGVAFGLSLPDVGSITPPRRIGDVAPSPPSLPRGPDYWGGKH